MDETNWLGYVEDNVSTKEIELRFQIIEKMRLLHTDKTDDELQQMCAKVVNDRTATEFVHDGQGARVNYSEDNIWRRNNRQESLQLFLARVEQQIVQRSASACGGGPRRSTKARQKEREKERQEREQNRKEIRAKEEAKEEEDEWRPDQEERALAKEKERTDRQEHLLGKKGGPRKGLKRKSGPVREGAARFIYKFDNAAIRELEGDDALPTTMSQLRSECTTQQVIEEATLFFNPQWHFDKTDKISKSTVPDDLLSDEETWDGKPIGPWSDCSFSAYVAACEKLQQAIITRENDSNQAREEHNKMEVVESINNHSGFNKRSLVSDCMWKGILQHMQHIHNTPKAQELLQTDELPYHPDIQKPLRALLTIWKEEVQGDGNELATPWASDAPSRLEHRSILRSFIPAVYAKSKELVTGHDETTYGDEGGNVPPWLDYKLVEGDNLWANLLEWDYNKFDETDGTVSTDSENDSTDDGPLGAAPYNPKRSFAHNYTNDDERYIWSRGWYEYGKHIKQGWLADEAREYVSEFNNLLPPDMGCNGWLHGTPSMAHIRVAIMSLLKQLGVSQNMYFPTHQGIHTTYVIPDNVILLTQERWIKHFGGVSAVWLWAQHFIWLQSKKRITSATKRQARTPAGKLFHDQPSYTEEEDTMHEMMSRAPHHFVPYVGVMCTLTSSEDFKAAYDLPWQHICCNGVIVILTYKIFERKANDLARTMRWHFADTAVWHTHSPDDSTVDIRGVCQRRECFATEQNNWYAFIFKVHPPPGLPSLGGMLATKQVVKDVLDRYKDSREQTATCEDFAHLWFEQMVPTGQLLDLFGNPTNNRLRWNTIVKQSQWDCFMETSPRFLEETPSTTQITTIHNWIGSVRAKMTHERGVLQVPQFDIRESQIQEDGIGKSDDELLVHTPPFRKLQSQNRSMTVETSRYRMWHTTPVDSTDKAPTVHLLPVVPQLPPTTTRTDHTKELESSCKVMQVYRDLDFPFGIDDYSSAPHTEEEEEAAAATTGTQCSSSIIPAPEYCVRKKQSLASRKHREYAAADAIHWALHYDEDLLHFEGGTDPPQQVEGETHQDSINTSNMTPATHNTQQQPPQQQSQLAGKGHQAACSKVNDKSHPQFCDELVSMIEQHLGGVEHLGDASWEQLTPVMEKITAHDDHKLLYVSNCLQEEWDSHLLNAHQTDFRDWNVHTWLHDIHHTDDNDKESTTGRRTSQTGQRGNQKNPPTLRGRKGSTAGKKTPKTTPPGGKRKTRWHRTAGITPQLTKYILGSKQAYSDDSASAPEGCTMESFLQLNDEARQTVLTESTLLQFAGGKLERRDKWTLKPDIERHETEDIYVNRRQYPTLSKHLTHNVSVYEAWMKTVAAKYQSHLDNNTLPPMQQGEGTKDATKQLEGNTKYLEYLQLEALQLAIAQKKDCKADEALCLLLLLHTHGDTLVDKACQQYKTGPTSNCHTEQPLPLLTHQQPQQMIMTTDNRTTSLREISGGSHAHLCEHARKLVQRAFAVPELPNLPD